MSIHLKTMGNDVTQHQQQQGLGQRAFTQDAALYGDPGSGLKVTCRKCQGKQRAISHTGLDRQEWDG